MVVAAVPGADEATARALIERCNRIGAVHVEGELDERIVGFYEDLRTVYPDFPPYDDSTPWSSTPLDTGIDHVVMTIRFSAENAMVDLIQRLATKHSLVLYDPQDDTVHLPPG